MCFIVIVELNHKVKNILKTIRTVSEVFKESNNYSIEREAFAAKMYK